MKYKNKSEEFFKNVASEYVNQDGERLKKELVGLEKSNSGEGIRNLDKKIDIVLRRNKVKKLFYYVASAAACLLITFTSFSLFSTREQNDNTNFATKEETKDIILLSSKLPEGYSILKADYDKGKTIYFVENETNNYIVLTVENQTDKINTSDMQKLDINGVPVYAYLKMDFNFMTFEKDKLLYTLTDQYNYEDLIALSKNLL